MLSVEVIRDWSRLEALVPRWRELLRRSSADSIFMTPEWIMAWRNAMQGLNVQPTVIHVTDQDQKTVGLALFYVSRQLLCNVVPYRVLRPMADYASGAVYHDVIADPAVAASVYARTFDALYAQSCDAVWIPQVAHWTGARENIVRAAAEAGFSVGERQNEFYCIDLPPSLAEYELRLTASMRKDLRRSTRKLFEQVGASVSECTSLQELDQRLDALIELNTKRWLATQQGGVFQRKPREADFYRHFVPMASQNGWLRLLRMDVDGKTVAMEIGYRYGDQYYAVQGSFDVAGPSGAGKVLLLETLKRELDAGTRAFDLLSGDESYKQRYAANGRPVSEFFLLRPSLKTLPLRLGRFWPRGRYLDFARPQAE